MIHSATPTANIFPLYILALMTFKKWWTIRVKINVTTNRDYRSAEWIICVSVYLFLLNNEHKVMSYIFYSLTLLGFFILFMMNLSIDRDVYNFFDPRGRPTIITCSDYCFCTCGPFVRPSSLFKRKQISSENNVHC